MKKIAAIALSLLMMLGVFAGCKSGANEGLADAKAYLTNMYQTSGKGEAMSISMDKDVLSVVTIDGVAYSVEWSIEVTEGDKDAVKIGESSKENHVSIDVPDLPEEDILFAAIATIKDEEGNTETLNLDYKVKGLNIPSADENNSSTLAEDESSSKEEENADTNTSSKKDEDTNTSSKKDNTTTSSKKDNNNTSSKKDNTTTSSKKENNTTTSSDKSSTSTGFNPTGKTAAQIMDAAYKLDKNEFMTAPTTLTGKVISVDKPYNEQYGSVTVTMIVDGSGKSIKCYNMKGNNTDKVKAGDTITVTGYITNFYYDNDDTTGDVEFTYHKDTETEVVMNKLVAGTSTEKKYTMVTNPVVGTAYKFGFEQTQLGKVLYATGAMSGFYMGTTETASASIDVYLENATGGYYLYTKVEGKKQYLNIQTSADGNHVNAVYRDTPDMVFTYDTTKNTLVTSKEVLKGGEGGIYGFGTYGTYQTIGTSKTSYDDNYYCHFYK